MTPKQMRETARELALSAKGKLESVSLSEAERASIAIITDQVNAFTLATMADVLETSSPFNRAIQARNFLERSNQIRAAAAKGFEDGDWSDFDQFESELNGESEG